MLCEECQDRPIDGCIHKIECSICNQDFFVNSAYESNVCENCSDVIFRCQYCGKYLNNKIKSRKLQKFLLTICYDSGFSEISNVCVIEAMDESDARDIYRKETKTRTEDRNIDVKLLSDIKSNWFYYM